MMFKLDTNIDLNPRYMSASAVDSALCVFDTIMDLLTASNSDNVGENVAPHAAYVLGLQNYGGTPALRDYAMKVGALVDHVWRALNNERFTELYGAPFDFEFVPNVMDNVFKQHKSWPLEVEPWFIAACEELQISDPRVKPLTIERVRENIPFMVDLLRDSGGPLENRQLFEDMRTAMDYLDGVDITADDRKSLELFIMHAEGEAR